MKKKHFIFDLDDTLTNSYEFNQQMFVDTFLPYYPDIDEAYLRDVHYSSRGKSMHIQFQEVVEKLKLDLDVQKLVSENEELHIKKIDKIGPFDDAENLLSLLKKNKKLISICTNRQSGSLMKIVNNNGFGKYCDNIISCIDLGYEKPDPYCLEMIIKKYKDPKDAYIYFGDSKTDHDFASNAGIDFIIIDQYLNKKQFFKMIISAFF